jgi:hypothetical protein
MKSQNRLPFVAEQLRRAIGTPDDSNVSDPYWKRLVCDDLAKGWGTPPGFKMLNFYVQVREDDPRLTPDGIRAIGLSLRQAAFGWLQDQTIEAERAGKTQLISCKTPNVKVVLRSHLHSDFFLHKHLLLAVEVYTYPALLPPVLTAGEGEEIKPV